MNLQRRGLRDMHDELSRRDLLRLAGVGLSGLGLAAIVGCGSDDGNRSPTSTPGIVVDPPPETTTIRLSKEPLEPRMAPLYVADQFLAEEGFTNVQYVDVPSIGGVAGRFIGTAVQQIAGGEIDIGLPYASSVTAAADAGDQLVILAGVHNSDFVLFGNDRVRSLRDLKGKRIWVLRRDAADEEYSLLAGLLAYVGIDLEREVEFVELSVAAAVPRLAEGTIDAWLAVRPFSAALRYANIGHVVIDGTTDPPYSQYFGGMATANRGFVEQHPVATKRALRAILKATDMCAREPERAAHYLVNKGDLLYNYDKAIDGITAVSYAAWREFNPEDTVRFYALRLNEAGIIKSRPDELIARSTDWHFLEEIKRELGVT